MAVIIGRWQIFKKSDAVLLNAALAVAPKVVVVIGAAAHSRDVHDPFTWQERQQQFESALTKPDRGRVAFLPVRDYYDDQRWSDAVRAGVAAFAPEGKRVSLVRFKKERACDYLDLFRDWMVVEVQPAFDISSTEVLATYFELEEPGVARTMLGSYVDPGVCEYLEAWARLPVYRQFAAEHRAVLSFRKRFAGPFYLTSDALVTAGQHLLLIRRGGNIGHGLWALPGGFVEPDERFYDAAVRELAEETGLKPSQGTLRRALRGQQVFDHPRRSARGRLITCAFHFDLGETALPEVRGEDDAKEAHWVKLAELAALEEELIEDHAVILDRFLGALSSWPALGVARVTRESPHQLR